MQFENRLFVLVGNFKSGDKNLVAKQMIEMAGGIVKDTPVISKKVGCVVVGANGYPPRKRIMGTPEEQVAERQKAGQNITLVSEEFLLDELAKIGITKDKWIKSYLNHINKGIANMKRAFDSINWSFEESLKKLRIEDSTLPNFLSMVEDAEIVAYAKLKEDDIASISFDNLPENATDEEPGSNPREYSPSDIKRILPWHEYSEDIVHLVAPNLIEVPPALFAWSKNLKTVELPSAKIIENGAFYECRDLEIIHMPEVLFIGNGAFAQCNSLKGRLDCGRLEYIGPAAFSWCNSLKALSTAKPPRKRIDGKTIQGAGYSLQAIGAGAFLNCKALKTVSFDKRTTVVGKNAFHGCPLLEETKTVTSS